VYLKHRSLLIILDYMFWSWYYLWSWT